MIRISHRVILDKYITLLSHIQSRRTDRRGHFDLRRWMSSSEGVVIAPGENEAGVMNAIIRLRDRLRILLIPSSIILPWSLALGDPREGVFDQIRSGHTLWFTRDLVFDVRPPNRASARVASRWSGSIDGGGFSAPGAHRLDQRQRFFRGVIPFTSIWTPHSFASRMAFGPPRSISLWVPKAYEAWADTQGLTGEDRRWTAERLQGSHLPNFARFIFGLGHAPTTEGELPESSVQEIDGQRYAVFSYRLLEAGRLFQPEVVFSEDLINEGEVVVHGQNGAIIEEDTDHYAPGLHRVRVHVPVAAENRTGFFRLRVASDLPD